jgi:hypothetical protein
MAKIWREHMILLICCLVAVLLLVLFGLLKWLGSSVLNLEAKWMIIAGVPILIGLIAGGYIKKFKGFGVELETELEKPVEDLHLTATDAMIKLPRITKDDLSKLETFTPEQIKGTKRLGFTSSRKHDYISEATRMYFEKLRFLEFVEVKNPSDEFLCLIPIEIFREPPASGQADVRRYNMYQIDRFIHALEEDKTLLEFGPVCITTTVLKDADLVSALKILRNNAKKEAAVVDADNQFVGLITEAEIERRIADGVLAVAKK